MCISHIYVGCHCLAAWNLKARTATKLVNRSRQCINSKTKVLKLKINNTSRGLPVIFPFFISSPVNLPSRSRHSLSLHFQNAIVSSSSSSPPAPPQPPPPPPPLHPPFPPHPFPLEPQFQPPPLRYLFFIFSHSTPPPPPRSPTTHHHYSHPKQNLP